MFTAEQAFDRLSDIDQLAVRACKPRDCASPLMLAALGIAAAPIIVIVCYFHIRSLVGCLFVKNKWANVSPETLAAQFLEGAGAVWNHPFFLGLASAKLFTPCLFAEYLYNGALLSWCLFAARLGGLVICAIFWNWLYSLGFSSVGQYIESRYKSQWLLGLYNLNTFLGLIYIYKNELPPLTFILIEFLKTGRIQSLAFFFFLMATSLGGFNLTMFSLTLLWFLDLIGQVVTLSTTSAITSFGDEWIDTQISPCFSNLGVTAFLPVLSQLLTILPLYRYYRSAKTSGKANISVIICVAVLTYDQLWSMLLATKVKHMGQSKAPQRPAQWLRSFLGEVHWPGDDEADQPVTTWNPHKILNTSAYGDDFWNISSSAMMILSWSILGQLWMFSVIHLHSLTVQTMEECTPSWLREAMITSLPELKVFYICLRVLFSVAVFVFVEEGIYSFVRADYRGIVFYAPTVESELATVVCSFTMIGPMLRAPGSETMASAAIIQIIGTHFFLQMLSRDAEEVDFVIAEEIWRNPREPQMGQLCGTAWLPSLVAVAFLIVMGLLISCFRFNRMPSGIDDSETGKETTTSQSERMDDWET
uniref:Lipase maturation factor n=1 Tax=Mesocestoides corti TaxID=53468 RepID=A0A5K3EUW6_MESCO